jgi:hypothetical protein
MDTANKKETLLDLSTNKVKCRIKIDDKIYELIDINELSILEREPVTKATQKLSGMSTIKTAAQEKEYDKTITIILSSIMIGDCGKVLKKLSIGKKVDIFMAYADVSDMIKKKVTRLTKGKRAKRKKRK